MKSHSQFSTSLATVVIAAGIAIDLSASKGAFTTAIGQTPHEFVAGLAFIAAVIAGLMGIEATMNRAHPAEATQGTSTFEPLTSRAFRGRVARNLAR